MKIKESSLLYGGIYLIFILRTFLLLLCQKPPVTDWWHVAERNTASWFLSMLRNFPYPKSELAFSHQLQTGGKFLTFLKPTYQKQKRGNHG